MPLNAEDLCQGLVIGRKGLLAGLESGGHEIPLSSRQSPQILVSALQIRVRELRSNNTMVTKSVRGSRANNIHPNLCRLAPESPL